ncbi:BgTH12-01064 [Blumeria graminis f. sp. triticale]|uniref:BgtE-6001 n=3 Tax=Blumeria graminis TaxID=34373 RepID=A0A061HF24_BLUGR|nr:putative secreted effector protein [Blumeria graminis f. sp. tritici 96224]CAD6505574.1 BgTH12-01064 [Blumeria graminis f. sp. triticale]VDB93708.1 BgtE-6001 [Blumeria graminis f. sp. tritici]
MNCFLAILLFTGGTSNENDRLVVMDLARPKNPHHTFITNKERWFPSVAGIDDLYVSPSPIKKVGTHMTIYCSNLRPSDYLFEFITRGTTRIYQWAEFGFQQSMEAESKCLKIIEDEFRRKSKKKLSASGIISKDECSISAIYSLGFQGKIRVIAKDVDTPSNNPDAPVVSFHGPIDLSDVLLNRQFIHVSTINKIYFGLAWYQGYLTVFRNDVHNTWRPISSHSRDLGQSRQVIKFLVATIPGVRLIINKLDTSQKHGVPGPEMRQLYENSEINVKNPSISNLIDVLGRQENRLQASYAIGFLGSAI